MSPETLYKYVPPDRIDVLVKRKIRFTQPCLWNDPFEFRPGMPAGAGRLGAVERRAAEKRDAAFRDKARLYGVLSLTTKNDSIPMWVHYAAAHTGLVIGFDTGSAGLFKEAIDSHKLQKVQYQSERVSLTRGLKDRCWVSPNPILWTKSLAWKHEEEWRWVESDPSKYRDEIKAAPNGELIFLRRIPPQSIREVILGCRSGSVLEQSIRTLKSDPDYKRLLLFKAALSKNQYKLDIEPV